jgi:hypothetical protein
MTCDTMADEDWLTRFDDRCYFYPARDCPGWIASTPCGRTGERIPEDAEGDDAVRA